MMRGADYHPTHWMPSEHTAPMPLPEIKGYINDHPSTVFSQVNGQVGLMCAANPDLHGEFQKWSTQWAAAQSQGATAAPAAQAPAPAPLSVQPSSLGAASSFGAAANANAGPLTPIMEGSSPAIAAGSAQKDKPAWPAPSPAGMKRETSSFGATVGSSEPSMGREASNLGGGGFNKPLSAPSTAGGFGGLGLSMGPSTTTSISTGSAAAQTKAGHEASAANAGGADLVWAKNHSPCSIVCVVLRAFPLAIPCMRFDRPPIISPLHLVIAFFSMACTVLMARRMCPSGGFCGGLMRLATCD